MNRTEIDEKWMVEAITLSTVCAPSDKAIPKVGAVIADAEGNLISSARRSDTGHRGDHAELKALALVPDRRKLPGATLYTTLEPCTPDVRSSAANCCSNLIIESGIKRVFVGILDPNQGVCGKGVTQLQKAGIDVELFTPTLAKEVRSTNDAFIVSQQNYGIVIDSPVANAKYTLVRGHLKIMASGTFEVAPDDDVSAAVIHAGRLWPQNEKFSTPEPGKWEVAFHFGAVGPHDLCIIKANTLGRTLIHYYHQNTQTNEKRNTVIKEVLSGLTSERERILQKVGNRYYGIPLQSAIPKGLEILHQVRVELV